MVFEGTLVWDGFFSFKIVKRPVGTCQFSFDLDLKVPRKAKTGEFIQK